LKCALAGGLNRPGFAGGSINSREDGAMTSKTTNKFSPEVRARAVRMISDHVNRQLKASRPNALWLFGLTCVATRTGVIYAAFLVDAYARRIAG
jgi:hypothetical protein